MEPKLSNKQMNERIAQLEEDIRRLQSELVILRSQKLVKALLKADGPMPRENPTVFRTERGLSVKGTRLTLYEIMDGIKAGTSLKDIRDMYELTDEEMLDILDYIHLHADEVENEYQQVLQASEENRKYWEQKNSGLMEQTYEQRELVRMKLREWREQYRAGQTKS